jgi:hypothetical protein
MMNTVELIPHRETPHNDLNSAYMEPSRPWITALAWIFMIVCILGVLGLALVDAAHQDIKRERRKQFENREMLRIFEETTRQQREQAADIQASINDLKQARKKMVDPR